VGFLLTALVWLQPWGLFLPSAVVALGRRWRGLEPHERTACACFRPLVQAVVTYFKRSRMFTLSKRLRYVGCPITQTFGLFAELFIMIEIAEWVEKAFSKLDDPRPERPAAD